MTGSNEQKLLGPAARLGATGKARTLRGPGAGVVIDGPFAETKEQLLGLYVVDCADDDAALAVARDLRKVNPTAVYEIRPIALYLPGEPFPTDGGAGRLRGLRLLGLGICRPNGECAPVARFLTSLISSRTLRAEQPRIRARAQRLARVHRADGASLAAPAHVARSSRASEDGGGRRTRTFEVIRRLIYSQLPLPLGTLPRLNSIGTHPLNGGGRAMDDVNTVSRWRAPGRARLWAKRHGKVNQRKPRNGPRNAQIAIIRNP